MRLLVEIFAFGLLAVGLTFGTPLTSLENREAPELGGFIEDQINKTINKLIANLTEEIDIDSLALNFTEEILSGKLNISDFELSGLKSLVASKINVAVLSLSMNLTINIPKIRLATKYFADVLLLKLVPLYGNGKIGVTLKNLELTVSGKANLTGGLSISNATVSIGLDDAGFDLHGLLDNEALSILISAVLNDNVVPFIDDNRERISEIISPIAEQIINAILSGGSNSTEYLEAQNIIETVSLQ